MSPDSQRATPSVELIEAAREMVDAIYQDEQGFWMIGGDGEEIAGKLLFAVEAADRLEARGPSREGWVLVPREPTDEMLAASEFLATGASRDDVIADYVAMVAVACPPLFQPPTDTGHGGEG